MFQIWQYRWKTIKKQNKKTSHIFITNMKKKSSSMKLRVVCLNWYLKRNIITVQLQKHFTNIPFTILSLTNYLLSFQKNEQKLVTKLKNKQKQNIFAWKNDRFQWNVIRNSPHKFFDKFSIATTLHECRPNIYCKSNWPDLKMTNKNLCDEKINQSVKSAYKIKKYFKYSSDFLCMVYILMEQNN